MRSTRSTATRACLARTESACSAGGWAYSIYDALGSATAVSAGFGVAATAAALLVIGYHTRIATAVSLVSAHGLVMRMPLVATGGDLLLVALLAWSLLVPLGARWSVDAALAPRRERPSSIATAGSGLLVAQMIAIVSFTGFAKPGSRTWRAGDGVYYALHAFQTTELGHALYAVPWLPRCYARGPRSHSAA